MTGRTFTATAIALSAFASNSIFGRLALRGSGIDPATYTTLRLVSGALVLLLLARASSRDRGRRQPPPMSSAVFLALYAVAFSFAYVSLPAGTGALILFGAVQATMLLSALRSGERPHPLEWTGLVVAIAGLVYLTRPGLAAPPLAGSLLMALSGAAWGFYSLNGRWRAHPLADTAVNFRRAAPLAIAVSVATIARSRISASGALLAVLSGALSSGIGYAIWYAALRGLTATRAAIVQLAVPVLTAAAAVVFLGESVSLRLVISAALILGGVGVALAGRIRETAPAGEGTVAVPGRSGYDGGGRRGRPR